MRRGMGAARRGADAQKENQPCGEERRKQCRDGGGGRCLGGTPRPGLGEKQTARGGKGGGRVRFAWYPHPTLEERSRLGYQPTQKG